MTSKKILAKSIERGGVSLFDHSVATLYVGLAIFGRIFKNDKAQWDNIGGIEKVRNELAQCLIFHDLGKAVKEFQEYLSNIKDKRKMVHNIIGWGFLKNYTNMTDDVLRTILYHHPADILSKDKKDIKQVGCFSPKEICLNYADDIDTLIECFNELNDVLCQNGFNGLSMEKKYDETKYGDVPLYPSVSLTGNGDIPSDLMDRLNKHHILRAIIISSDRIVSTYYKDIKRFIDNDVEFINKAVDKYTSDNIHKSILDIDFYNIPFYHNEKTLIQNDIVENIRDRKNTILALDTGGGKTMIAFRWWAYGSKKLFWASPNISVAKSTYNELNGIVEKIGLSDSIKIALVVGGNYIVGDENCSIIVCVIDSFLARNFRNDVVHQLLWTFDCDVVFDEYQMYTMEEALFSSFITMVGVRCRFTNSRTLLMSATPPMYHNMFWGEGNIDFVDCGVIDKDKKITIIYEEIPSIDNLSMEKDSICIVPTVNNSQDLCKNYGHYDETILIHTQFYRDDINRIINETLENRGRESDIVNRKLLIGTDIFGTGVNISAQHIYDGIMLPDNSTQKCGRGNRFGEYGRTYLHFVEIGDNTNRMYEKLLGSLGVGIRNKWSKFIKDYDGKTISKKEFYAMYHSFIEKEDKNYKKYYKNCFTDSSYKLSLLRPYRAYTQVNDDDSLKRISSKPTLRGGNDNIYVIAKHNNGELMKEPIQLQKFKVNDDEKSKTAAKIHCDFFKEKINNNDIYKYVYGMKTHSDETNPEKWFVIARNPETPLFLANARYDKKLGLVIPKPNRS